MYALVSSPAVRAGRAGHERYEVTVHVRGHRLGGKCATGRGPNGRIEEHGIHMFFGSYALTWRTFGRIFADWAQPETYPLSTLARAFEPSDGLTLCEEVAGTWQRFPVRLPRRGPHPWELPDDGRDDVPPIDTAPTRWLRELVAFVDGWIEAREDAVSLALATFWRRARRLFRVALRATEHAESVLASVLDLVQSEASRRLLGGWDVLAREGIAVACAIARGLLRDRPASFEDLDAWELRAWLRERGGLAPELLDCAVVRAVYVSGFAQLEGREDIAAGTAIATMFRTMLRYQGSVGYHFRSATGDVLFVPLYEVLRDKYGVRFAFFHDVTGIEADDDGFVSRIAVDVQAEVKGEEYLPLTHVNGVRVWPSAPLAEQLADAARIAGRDLEDASERVTPASRLSLRRGVDFDAVILGIPAPALRRITPDLASRSPRWRAMLDHVRATPTFCVSVWWKLPAGELGAVPPPYADRIDVATYARPMPLLVDFSQTLWSEHGSGEHVFYLSDAWTTSSGHAASEREALVRASSTWLGAHLGWLYPNAVARGALRHELLSAPDSLSGEARLRHQWFRVNVDASEQYVLSVAGSGRHRLAPDDSGFANLFLAGDWTKNGIDLGCVEATVRSALLCAKGLQRWASGRAPEEVAA